MATGGIGNIGKVPELQKRILFTLGMLAIYRVGCAVPVPGVDATAITAFGTVGVDFGLFGIFGKLGYASWDLKASAAGLGSASGSCR